MCGRISRVIMKVVLIALITTTMWLLQGCADNNEEAKSTPTMTKEELKQQLEAKGVTEVIINGQHFDITEAVWKSVVDIEKAIKGTDMRVNTGVDMDKVKPILKSGYTLDKFEKFDWKKMMKKIEVDKAIDVSDCVVLKYDQKVIDLYNKCCEWSGSYKASTKGGIVIDSNECKAKPEYVKIKKNKVVFNDKFIDKFLRKLEKEWDNLGRTMKVELFSKKGKKKKLGGTWGTLMDSAKEKAYLIKMFHKGKSFEDREPHLKVDHRGKLGNTRIEVSIADQKIWVYKKGKCIRTSSVVTGKDGHSTPKGLYYMSERVPGKYLVGDDYKTWVNRWMRLTDRGVGLHDANWRSNFGGTIYHSSGSHGCVNLPSSFAYWLYPKTYYGEPVIVY